MNKKKEEQHTFYWQGKINKEEHMRFWGSEAQIEKVAIKGCLNSRTFITPR